MEQLRPLGVKTLAQFSYYTAKKEKNSGEIAFVETETHNSYFQIGRLDSYWFWCSVNLGLWNSVTCLGDYSW